MRPSGTRRIPYLDTISGVLIVFMIYTHIIQRSDLDGLPSYRFMETVFFFFPAGMGDTCRQRDGGFPVSLSFA